MIENDAILLINDVIIFHPALEATQIYRDKEQQKRGIPLFFKIKFELKINQKHENG